MHDKLRSGNYDWIVKYRSWHLKGNSLFISCLTDQGWEAQVIVRAVSKNIWNCTFVAPDSEFLKLTDFINEEFSEPLQISFEEIATGLLLKCDNLKLMINRDPWKMSFYNESDEVILTETYSSNEFNDPAKIQLGYYLEDNKCVYTTQSFCLRQDEYLFGLGEHPVSQIRAGSKLVLWNRDLYSSDSIHSNKNVPFFFSTKGYGMFINSAAEIDLGFGTGMATSYNILNKNNVLDIFIIEGTTPAGIINSYTALTGKAGAPPAWTYGMCISAGEEYLSQRAIDEMLDKFEGFKISGDVLLICPSSLNSRKYSRFMRDANLKQLFSNIHSRGLKICLRIHPYVPIENELYHQAKIQNYLVKKSNGDVYIIDFTNSDNSLEGAESTFRCRDLRNSNAAFIDFTNPDACSWYKDLYKYFFEAGADILSTEYGDDIPDDAVFFSGETGTTIHNLYSLLFNRIVFEITKQYKSYGTVFSRSGTAGIQKYSVSWSLNNGIDFEHLACTLKRGISAGLSGIPFWGICVDRVTEKLTKELLIRWIQFSVLCSHFRIPADILSGPHSHDEQTLAILKEQILLRYSLYPYIFNLAHEGCISGLPVIRSKYLLFC